MCYLILGSYDLPYRYYKCNVYNITDWTKSIHNEERYLNSILLSEVSSKYDNNVSVNIEYTYNDNIRRANVKLKTELKRIYFEDELDILEEDIENLNEILEFKKQQKQLLKKYINKKLETWNYRGEISI